MKTLLHITLLSLYAFASTLNAKEEKTLIYVNKNLGFNVPGYKYKQKELPCKIDKNLVNFLVRHGAKSNLKVKPVGTSSEINNGTIPVLVMDIEQLVLGKNYRFGKKTKHPLPKVQVIAGLIQGKDVQTAKHTCAIATLNEFTPSSNVLDLGTPLSVCSATKKCLKDLSKDIIEWLAPQVK